MITETTAQAFQSRIGERNYPCVAARAALAKGQISFFEVGDLRSEDNDQKILCRLYQFIAAYRANFKMYTSLIITFSQTPKLNESAFEITMWERLQALHNRDRRSFSWSKEASADPSSADFGLSLGGEAFFIIGMHPGASRRARRFKTAALVFNLHDQFTKLRESGKFESIRDAIRNRDKKYSGSANPMLADFHESSEAAQYSGREVDKEWKCPFQAKN